MTTRLADYQINRATLRVAYGDITQLVADALVSSDDNYLSMGGGVSAALLNAGGEIVRTDARKHLPLQLGEVAVASAGNLHAKYIFHAVTIDYTKMVSASEDSIRAAVLRCMQLADTLGVRLIAFPALGTGVASFPFQLAAEVMTRSIADYLLGETQIELVTITLFPRERVTESDLNQFYERAVALAAVSTQSKRLGDLVAELGRIVGPMNVPQLSKHLAQLQAELRASQEVLVQMPGTLEGLEEIEARSDIKRLGKEVVTVSSKVHEALTLGDKELEAEVLRTKLNGLLTQLNIQVSHLNRFEIEKAKYGGQLVPPRLEIAIEDMQREIADTEARVSEVRVDLTRTVGPASI